MKVDIKNLPDSSEQLKNIIFSLHQSLTEKQNEAVSYKSKYENILEQLRLAKQKQFARSSEKSIAHPDMFDEAGIELPTEVQEQLSEQQDEITVAEHTRKKKPKRCHLPEDLPRETIIHDVTENEKICGCGKALVRIGEEVTEQLKYIPAQLSVVQHVRPKYACKPCQETVKIAPMPALLLPKSIATPELVSHIIISVIN